MDSNEIAVLEFLTTNLETFAIPQFDIGNGWSQPDIVAIRPPKKVVYIAEVTSAYRISGLAEKARQRKQHWIDGLSQHLLRTNVIESDWRFEVLIFLRQDRIPAFKAAMKSDAVGIYLIPLEFVLMHWQWPESLRQPGCDFSDFAH